MFSYLVYKIKNELLLSFREGTASTQMLTLFGELPQNLDQILFDFSDSTTHLGDRLFFFPLIAQLYTQGYSLHLNRNDKATRPIFYGLYGADPFAEYSDHHIDLVVIPKPSYLNKSGIHKSLLVVDFAESKISTTISQALVGHFNSLFGIVPMISNLVLGTAIKDLAPPVALEGGKNYYLFSNYINSGLFRKWFLDENVLSLKCIELKKQGYKIIHVGSEKDRAKDRASYPYVDLDLRGKLNLVQLISLVASSQVKGAITYDNFLMHLVGIFNKIAFVLFRGRFIKAGRIHHYEHINTTFFSKENRPQYL